MGGERQSLVIVGAGMVAGRLLGDLARLCPGRYDVTVLGAEPHEPYNRILLSPLLAGERNAADLALEESRALPDAVFRLGDPVAAIERGTRQVVTRSGIRVRYDRAVLALGSRPIRPLLAGIDLEGVFTFRNREDADALIGAASEARCAVVVGGGLLGLEAAHGLMRRGLEVTVVHLMDWLMERQLDAQAADLLRASLVARGIKVLLKSETEALTGEGRVTGLRLKGGQILPADLIVFAVGTRPNVALARETGLAVGRGVVVDDAMATDDPAILAIGECAEHRGSTYGLVAPLWEQAAIAASQLAGDAESLYSGSVPATSLKVTGIELFSAGNIAASADAEEIVLEDRAAGIYRKLVLRGGRLTGAVLLGDSRDGAWYADLMRRRADIRPFRQDLVFGRDFLAVEATP